MYNTRYLTQSDYSRPQYVNGILRRTPIVARSSEIKASLGRSTTDLIRCVRQNRPSSCGCTSQPARANCIAANALCM